MRKRTRKIIILAISLIFIGLYVIVMLEVNRHFPKKNLEFKIKPMKDIANTIAISFEYPGDDEKYLIRTTIENLEKNKGTLKIYIRRNDVDINLTAIYTITIEKNKINPDLKNAVYQPNDSKADGFKFIISVIFLFAYIKVVNIIKKLK